MARRYEEPGNPVYDIGSAALSKWRFRARDGLKSLPRDERQAYGAAVEAAVLSAQRAQLKGHGESMPNPTCASGTWHTTGEAIHEAMRAKQRAALLAGPAQIRRARTPAEWAEMYEAAMKEKRERENAPIGA